MLDKDTAAVSVLRYKYPYVARTCWCFSHGSPASNEVRALAVAASRPFSQEKSP